MTLIPPSTGTGTRPECQLAPLPLQHIVLFSLHWGHVVHGVIILGFGGREEEGVHAAHPTKIADCESAGMMLMLMLPLMKLMADLPEALQSLLVMFGEDLL